MKKMTPQTFRNNLERASKMFHSSEMEKSGALFSELYDGLNLDLYQRRLSLRRFDKVFPGLEPNDVMALLYNRVAWCMNIGNCEEALKCILDYKLIMRDFQISCNEAFTFEMAKREIEVNRRLARNDKALQLCDELLSANLTHAERSKILLTKGSIESDEAHWIFNINSMSEALGEAEADGSEELIGRCYLELAKMIGTHYPALGLSLLWKARIISEKSKDDEMVAFCKERMAMSYFLLWHRTNDKGYIDEASRLVNEDIDRNVFMHPGAKAGFDRLKGLINNDLTLIGSSLDFFESVHAWGEALRTAEFYIKVSLTIGDKDEAKKGASQYERVAEALNDDLRLNYIRAFDPEHAVVEWNPPVKKKGIPDLLDVLDSIALDEERFNLEKSAFRSLFPTHYQEGKFEPVTMGDGRARLYPLGLVPYRYYRGQSDKLEGKACVPSLYRGLAEAEMFYERLFLMELEIMLADYPLTEVFVDGLEFEVPGGKRPLPLVVDSTALGQHYGIKTDLLDLTVDKWVAAFFASTKYENGQYKPVKEDGEGVIYVYNDIPSMGLFGEERLSAVGMQPFSRPGRQAGLVYKLKSGEDFNKKAKRIVFKHDPKISELIFNYCNRSKRLFPEEILEDKVIEIRNSAVHSKKAHEMTVERYYKETPQEIIQSYIAEKGISIQNDSPVVFTEAEKEACVIRWNKEKDHVLENIQARLSYTEPIEVEESNGREI